MLNDMLFEFADIECADNYVMAKEVRTWEETLKYIETKNLRIENLILKPKTNQMRFMFKPCQANEYMTEVFNVNNPPVHFLRRLWELDLPDVQNALTKFMVQGYKDKYDNMEEDDKTWLTAAVLGSKDD